MATDQRPDGPAEAIRASLPALSCQRQSRAICPARAGTGRCYACALPTAVRAAATHRPNRQTRCSWT